MSDGFFESCIAAYGPVVSNPLALSLMAFGVVESYSLYFSKSDPLLELLSFFDDSKDVPKFILTLISFLTKFFNFVASHRSNIVPIIFIWIPYVVRPDSSNLVFNVVLSVLSLVFKTVDIFYIVLASQLWFLYSELNRSTHKALIILISAASLAMTLQDV